MPTITGPILDSSGRPANGYLRVRASRPFDIGAGHVTEALGTAAVVAGEPRVAGGAWSLPETPEGVSLMLVQDLDGEQAQQFSITVPSRNAMTYSELLFHRGGSGSGSASAYVWELTAGEDFQPGALHGDIGIDFATGETWRNEEA